MIARLDDHRAQQQARGHRQRSLTELLGELDNGASSLATTVTTWKTFLPRPAAMDEAERSLEGLLRLVRELRTHSHGGTGHAA